jgi:ATP-dependent RNA helicase SUPV3L1/SUV3
MLLATAERRLSGEYEKRAAALVADKDDTFTLRTEAGSQVAISGAGMKWRGSGPGKNLLSPRVHLDRRLERVSERGREAVIERLKLWVRHQVERTLGHLRVAGMAAQDPGAAPAVRSILAMLVDEGGIVAREAVHKAVAALDRDQRRAIAKLKVGSARSICSADVLKTEARRCAPRSGPRRGEPCPRCRRIQRVLPHAGQGERLLQTAWAFARSGRRCCVSISSNRLARHAHEARAGKQAAVIDDAWSPRSACSHLRGAADDGVGFRPSRRGRWIWRGRAAPARSVAPIRPSLCRACGAPRG